MDTNDVEIGGGESEFQQAETNQNFKSQKLNEKQELEKWLQHELNEIINDPSTNDGLPRLETLLKDPNIATLMELIQEIQQWDVEKTIPDRSSFLNSCNLQSQLIRMLQNSFHYRKYLECFLARFDAINESVDPEQNTPLHYAVKQLNKDLIKWLLSLDSIDVNARNEQSKSPLLLLCEDYQQGRDVRDCILQLLDKGANFNVYCGCKMLPFELLMHDPSEENLKFLEECAERHRYGAIAIGKTNVELKQRFVGFYQDREDVQVTVELLEVFLGFGEHERFVGELVKLKVDEGNVRNLIKVLLHTAVKMDFEECVKKIVNVARSQIFRYKDGGMVYRVELKGLLKKACASGNVNILKLLLDSMNDKLLVNEDPLLVDTLNRALGDKRNIMLECANCLINSGKINYSLTDCYGNTALHCAVKSGSKQLTVKLLQLKGNFLGTRNKDNLTPLDYAGYEFWKYCFDKCLKRVQFPSNPDDDEIWFNYNCFVPHDRETSSQSNCCSKSKCWTIVEEASAGNIIGTSKQSIMTEMDPLMVISKSKELQNLLQHPLLQTFIQIKWKGMNKWCYLNMVFTLLTLCGYSWYSWNACNASHLLSIPMLLTVIGIVYMIFREIVQVDILRCKYLTSLENLLDILALIGTALSLSIGCNPILSSIIVIAFVRQLTILIGSLPFRIATYMHMFNTITYNFLLSFLLFIPWLAAFTYCFYLSHSINSNRAVSSDSSNESFNTFGTLTNAALKTLVMTTGEFDAASLDLNGGKMILLVLFIFFVSFVFLNLINGLAVSDISEIRRQSELIAVRKKVMILYRNDRGIRNGISIVRLFSPGSFLKKHHSEIKVKPKEIRKILVLPKNQTKKSQETQYESIPCSWQVLPIISKCFLSQNSLLNGLYLNFKSKIPLFYTLPEQAMDEVLKIVEQNSSISNGNDSKGHFQRT